MVCFGLCSFVSCAPTTPGDLTAAPYSGTIFVDGDVITGSDPSEFQSLTYLGQQLETMYDRRTDSYNDVNAFVFTATYSGSGDIKVRVNPEFGSSAAAQVHADRFARDVGRMPRFLREGLRSISVQDGLQLFGGGGGDILIHLQQADAYGDILEETLVHEATHASVDALFYGNLEYKIIQSLDNQYISTYAQTYPDREDVSESILLWIAYRYRRDRISTTDAEKIFGAISNRMSFYESRNFSMSPIQ